MDANVRRINKCVRVVMRYKVYNNRRATTRSNNEYRYVAAVHSILPFAGAAASTSSRWPATNCCRHTVFHYVAYNNPIIALISARTETNKIIGLTFDLFIVYRWRLLRLAATAASLEWGVPAPSQNAKLFVAHDHSDQLMHFPIPIESGAARHNLADANFKRTPKL